MNKEIWTEVKFIAVLTIILFAVISVGKRHTEHIENTAKICDKIGLQYEAHSNFFGNVTRIYIKEDK